MIKFGIRKSHLLVGFYETFFALMFRLVTVSRFRLDVQVIIQPTNGFVHLQSIWGGGGVVSPFWSCHFFLNSQYFFPWKIFVNESDVIMKFNDTLIVLCEKKWKMNKFRLFYSPRSLLSEVILGESTATVFRDLEN